jgi:lipopolysaccharide transport system permease protein
VVLTTEAKPLSVIQKRSIWHALSVTELWQCRDLLIALIEKDIKLRYRQTALGILWILLQPLMGAAIFSVVFHRVAGLQAPSGVPYFVLSFAGLLCWNAFNTSVIRSSSAVLQNSHMISKVYFPRLLLPISTGFGALTDFAVGFSALLVLLFVNHIHIGRAACIAPVWCLVCIVLGIGLGCFFGALMVWYRDVQYVLPVALQFLMYGSPVAYTLAQALPNLPVSLRVAYLANPLVGSIECFRRLAFGEPLLWNAGAYSILCAIGTLVAGVLVFACLERSFADVI